MTKFEPTTDLEVLNAARQKVVYNENKNSLVEWTLSDAWVPKWMPQAKKDHRGYVERETDWYGFCSEVSGEFNAR